MLTTHPSYPQRLFAKEYDEMCVYHTDPSVIENAGKWADHENVEQSVLEQRKTWIGCELISQELPEPLTLSNAGIRFVDGKPKNPNRTGLRGRGLLGLWGPNHAADPIVTRNNPITGDLEFVAVRRKDTGEWAIPGGMFEPGEKKENTLRREFTEGGC